MTGGLAVALSNGVENLLADGLGDRVKNFAVDDFDIVIANGAELCSYYVLYPGASRPASKRAQAPASGIAPPPMAEAAGQTACKPGSVPARTAKADRRGMAIHLGRPLPDASRDLPGRRLGNPPAERPSEEGPRARRPYSVLLPVGFAVPFPSPGTRCALTAPFHPCRPLPEGFGRRFAFCGTFPGVAPAGCYPAPCFRGARTFLLGRERIRAPRRPSGRLAPPLRYLARDRRQADRRRQSASTPASRPMVSPSARPFTRAGRKWR